MADGIKDKEMASNLKKAGECRNSMRCPVCSGVISGGRRIAPAENNEKGFSHNDFAGALHNHFQRCGHTES